MNNNTNNHHDSNGEERPSHFSNYYGGSKPPDVSLEAPKRRTTGRRKSSFTAKLFSSSKPTNNNNHNESSSQQQNREMLFSADGMLPDPRCEMRAMIECQQLKPGVCAANNNNVSAAERFKYGHGNNNNSISQNRAAEEVTEHHDTHHHEHDDIIAVTNSANRFKFGIQQLQQQQHNCDDHDDSGGRQPYTRPSCPQYKRTTNMGLIAPVATTTTSSSGSCSNINNGYCAFDVNATRAELLSKLEGKRRKGGGGPTLKCSTVQEIDEDLLRERESTPSSSFFTQTTTPPPPPEFRGSLRDCLIGMGLDDDAIIKAMVACNASESKDVENVIEWSDDHREVVGVGEGAVRSGDAYYHHHDDNNNNNNKINHESFCDESHYTQTSLHTRTSHSTAQTEESNEEIRILAHSLKDLGFDHVEIREKKELYRRASKNNGLLNAEGFIAAMFEVDDEIVGSSSSSSRVVKSRVKSEPLLAGDDNDDDNDGNNDWKRSASLSHHRKQRNQTDSELFSFLSTMGFSMEKIESAIQSLRNEGTNDIIDAEAVVAVLLSQQHEEKSRSSSGALLPLVTLDNSHGGSSKTTTADELEQNEFMKIEVTPGNFAPVLKARQTVQAISDGTAVSVQCTVCSVTLQCCPDAEYVLCPDCDVVSPILSQYRRLASSDRVAGSDGSCSQSSHHSARSNRRMSTGGMIGAIGLGKKSRR
jgi:hypothetical protein